MRAAQLIGVGVLAGLCASEAQSQWTWSVAGGPLLAAGRSFHSLGDGFSSPLGDTVVTNGDRGRGAASFSVSRAIPHSALSARLELTYQLATSDPRSALELGWGGSASGPAVRAGLRDETLGLHPGLEWNAYPGKVWSPYLVTSVGTTVTRVRWSADSNSTTPNREVRERGTALTFGFGMKSRLWKVDWFWEGRRQSVHGRSPSANTSSLLIGARFTP